MILCWVYRKPEHNFWDYKKVEVLCNLVCQCQEIHGKPISEKFYSPEYTLFLCVYTNLHKRRAYLFLNIWCRCSHEASIWNAQIFINNRMNKQIVLVVLIEYRYSEKSLQPYRARQKKLMNAKLMRKGPNPWSLLCLYNCVNVELILNVFMYMCVFVHECMHTWRRETQDVFLNPFSILVLETGPS